MSRTQIADELIHRPDDFRKHGERLDSICEATYRIAFPIIREALIRETVDTKVEVWVEEVQMALKLIGSHLDELDPSSVEGFSRVFADMKKPPLPSEKEVMEHTHDVSRLMVTSWIELLRSRLSEKKELMLSRRLFPEKEWPDSWKIMQQAVSSFAVNDRDVTTIMNELRDKLLSPHKSAELPFNIVLLQPNEELIFAARK